MIIYHLDGLLEKIELKVFISIFQVVLTKLFIFIMNFSGHWITI
jgi:hypothetical protein